MRTKSNNVLLAAVFCCFCGFLTAQTDLNSIVKLNHKAAAIKQKDPIKAKLIAQEALVLALAINNDTLVYEARFTKGIANYNLGNLNEALEDFIANKALAKKIKNQKKLIASINAIANVYKDNERFDLALQSYNEALKICSATNDVKRAFLIKSNIAIVYTLQGKFDSSNYYCFSILKDFPSGSKKDYQFISNLYGNIFANFLDLKQKDSVLKYTDTVLSLKRYCGDIIGYAGNLCNLSEFYLGQKEYDKAEKGFRKALAEKPDNIELVANITKALALTLRSSGKYEESASLFLDYIVLWDSIFKIQTVDKLSEMEVKYETGKKEEELRRMGAEKEVTDLKAKQSQIWLIVASTGILFVIIIALVLFKQNKNRQHANKLLQQQNNEIIHQKKEITDSINYAKRIQLAILPPDKMVKKLLPTAFVMYKPKDVVSGDFYWMEEKNGFIMFAAVDCTGHGVPGAMMSVVGLNLLNQAVKEKGLTVPSDILSHLDSGVTETLRQSGDTDSIKDGMDLSVCSFNPKTLELQYAGAFNNLWVVRKNISVSYKLKNKNEVFFEENLLEIKADKFPIGSNLDGVTDNYTNHTLQLQKGDCVYLYSDGYADQFGGPKGKKFKYNALKKLLVSIHHLPAEEQREKLFSAFESWRGNLEQIDDILVMGVCV